MSVPNQINDGNWTVATQTGPGWWTLPFVDKGDTQSFEYHAKFRQAAANYTPLLNTSGVYAPPPLTPREATTTITTARGTAYLVDESQTSDVGCGILEFTRTYASLPVRRTEGSTITYAVQFVSSGGFSFTGPPPLPEIAELPLTMNADIVYEYSIAKPDVIISPRVVSIFGTLLYLGDWVQPVANDYVVAEDSAISIYRGYFYQRRTPYIYYPDIVP